MTRDSTEPEWLQWIEIQKNATHTWISGDLHGAIGILDRFVASEVPLDLKRQALGFRGSLYQEQGNLMAAKRDFLAARDLAKDRDYERYSLEESVGAVSYDLGDVREAEHWYLEALRTAAVDPRSTGGSALLSLLEIRDQSSLSDEERRLAELVVRQAWLFHGLPGSPDVQELQAAAQALVQAECTPRHRESSG